jgi:hypothetical protein
MEVLVLVSMGSWKEDRERAEIEGRGHVAIASSKLSKHPRRIFAIFYVHFWGRKQKE